MLLFSDGRDLADITQPLDLLYMQHVRRGMLLFGAWPGKLLGEKEVLRKPFQYYNIVIIFFALVSEALYLRTNVSELSFFDLGQSYITELMTCVTFTRCSALLFMNYDSLLQKFLTDIHLIHFKDKSKYAMKCDCGAEDQTLEHIIEECPLYLFLVGLSELHSPTPATEHWLKNLMLKTHIIVHKLSRFFTAYLVLIVFWTAIFFNLPPLFNNIFNGGFERPFPSNFTYEHSVYYSLPFDYTHDIKGFTVIFIFNWYISFFYAIVFGTHDLVLAIYMFHLWGHLNILNYNLENFPRPMMMKVDTDDEDAEMAGGISDDVTHSMVNTRYSPEEMVIVAQRMKEMIEHHIIILRFTKAVSDTFGLSIFIFYAFEQVTLCLLLLECSQMSFKTLVRFGPLTIGLLFLLIQTSVVFELIRSRTDPLMRAVYNVPWECMDTKNRKLVHLMLMQAQIPLGLKAMGLVEVGCQTMAAIIKTTVSYFVMLRTFAINNE